MQGIGKVLWLIAGLMISTQPCVATEITNTTVTTTSSPQKSPISTNNPNPEIQTTVISVTNSPSGPSDADAKIISAIYAKFAKAAALIGTSLTVSCLNGFVTISGSVTAQSQADEAVIAAKSVPGVKDATSQINVKTNPKKDDNQNAPNY